MHFSSVEKLVTMRRWIIHTIFATRIDSLAWNPQRRCIATLGIPKPLFFPCAVAEKNSLWPLWTGAYYLLRSTTSFDSRPLLRRQTCLPLFDGSAGRLLVLRQGQDRASRLAFRPSWLHKAVRLPGRATMSRCSCEGGCRGIGTGLANGQ